MSRKKDYELVNEEGWDHLTRRGWHLACCDCGLVHDIDGRVDEKGRIWLRVRRNERRTAALRRGGSYGFVEKE